MQHSTFAAKMTELNKDSLHHISTLKLQTIASMNNKEQTKETFDLTNKLLTSTLQLKHSIDDELKKLYSKFK